MIRCDLVLPWDDDTACATDADADADAVLFCSVLFWLWIPLSIYPLIISLDVKMALRNAFSPFQPIQLNSTTTSITLYIYYKSLLLLSMIFNQKKVNYFTIYYFTIYCFTYIVIIIIWVHKKYSGEKDFLPFGFHHTENQL